MSHTSTRILDLRYREVIVPQLDCLKNTQTIHSGAEWYQREGERIFPNLPPLFYGHSDVHLRNGIMHASSRSAAYETNAEKAFFVADLSEVYRQFQRWKKCLPEIQPCYGERVNYLPIII